MELAQRKIDKAVAKKNKADEGVTKAHLKVVEAEGGIADVCSNIEAQARALDKRAIALRKLINKY